MNEVQMIQSMIYEVRGQKVMLDFDLATLYQVETRVLNQSVKRNINRFPADFMFQLTPDEWAFISSQYCDEIKIETSKIGFAICLHRTWNIDACKCIEK